MRIFSHLVALLALFCVNLGATTALAQPMGPVSQAQLDTATPLFAGQVRPQHLPPYVPQPLNWATGTNEPVVGDGSATGGFAPSYTLLPDYLTPNPETMWATRNVATQGGGCGGPDSIAPCGRPHEIKARFTVGTIPYPFYNDPLRNWGKPGTSHLHTFYGNCQPHAFATAATLRRDNGRGDCTNAEGQFLNAVSYWQPALITRVRGTPPALITVGGQQAVALADKGAGTQKAAIKFKQATIYYIGTQKDRKTHPYPVGLGYIGGFNMDNPNKMIAIKNAANAQAGWNRYSLNLRGEAGTDVEFATRHQWTCDGVSGSTPSLRRADGTDPFNGQCGPGQTLRLFAMGPTCWDGVNLWSPTGYDHLIYPLRDAVTNSVTCPQGWYHVPRFELNIGFDHQGFAPRTDGLGYGAWTLDSDWHAQRHEGGMGTLPGASFHFDYLAAWDRRVQEHWVRFCMGSVLLGGTQTMECNDGQISETLFLPDWPGMGSNTAQEVVIVPEVNTGMIMTHTRRGS
ncbi:DUF1996 domain-containing protein [Erythrobacteraceae bacterium CFH 75059]|uniref:DUF1996 domain-containing protein n=1 Tax=Qipengyuania thermophila TaxID=2509361 RepID=UPI0010206544|nr:DUF1996 domain-containing protein [Qipengyuania thermophila]TCD04286.1 DUF1996 domain-containing protein [Erythrobacteraceae bacterium CFH 75059]